MTGHPPSVAGALTHCPPPGEWEGAFCVSGRGVRSHLTCDTTNGLAIASTGAVGVLFVIVAAVMSAELLVSILAIAAWYGKNRPALLQRRPCDRRLNSFQDF